MLKTKYMLTALTAAAIGFAGIAEARDQGGRDYSHRQGHAQYGDFADRVDRRQDNQRHRIKEGWRSGDLTRKEMRKLRKDQKRIARMEDRFGADGYYSPRERRKLKNALSRSSDRIRYFKHNDWRPGSHGHGHADRGHHRGWHKPRYETHHHYYNYDHISYEPSNARSLAVDLILDGFSVSWSKQEQF